jgi:hypothetical protein
VQEAYGRHTCVMLIGLQPTEFPMWAGVPNCECQVNETCVTISLHTNRGRRELISDVLPVSDGEQIGF